MKIHPLQSAAASTVIALLLAGCATSATDNRPASIAQLDADVADAQPCPAGMVPVSHTAPGAGQKCRTARPALSGDPKQQALRQPIAVGLGGPVPAYFGGSKPR